MIVVAVRSKRKANYEKVEKFNIEMVNVSSIEAKKIPKTPPAKERIRASIRNEANTDRRKNPRERKMPISEVLLATDEYIVIMAPIIAPRLKIPVTTRPSTFMKLPNAFDC